VRYCLSNMRSPGRNVNSGASDRPLHSDPIFGRNAREYRSFVDGVAKGANRP
jgi:hypothetical protein